MSYLKIKTLKNAIIIASVYLGTVLGAGFASGQEMMSFFITYGNKGIFGLILMGVIFGILAYMVLKIIYTNKCNSYGEFIELIIGRSWSKVLEVFILLFMFICFSTMFAGTGALLEQRFNLPFYYGVIFMAIGCFLTFLFEVKGIVLINIILAPIMLIGAIILGIYTWIFDTAAASNFFPHVAFIIRDNWLSSSLIYIAYNSITAIVVLGSLGYLLNKKRTVVLSALLGGISLGLIGLIFGLILLLNYDNIFGFEIPILEIVMNYSTLIQYLYIILLISAIFTTAVANGFGIIEKLKENKKLFRNKSLSLNIGIIVAAILFSNIGFSTMVGKIYPIFGYIGMLEIICISIYFIKHEKRKSR